MNKSRLLSSSTLAGWGLPGASAVPRDVDATDLHGLVRRLAPGKAATWPCRPGARLTVVAGRIWLTEAGGGADHFVAAGGAHVVTFPGPVVVECDSAGPAVVVLRGAGLVKRIRSTIDHWRGRALP